MVAIPSNRVNVSYQTLLNWMDAPLKSQSPQIGSMFPTPKEFLDCPFKRFKSQSPQIGSMFPTPKGRWVTSYNSKGRNPLKSGQCFLQFGYIGHPDMVVEWVAIPSNRVNVSYAGNKTTVGEIKKVAIPSNRVNVSYIKELIEKVQRDWRCRNPLKSGQCFLLEK